MEGSGRWNVQRTKDLNDSASATQKSRVASGQRAPLTLRHGDVLGVVRLGPAQQRGGIEGLPDMLGRRPDLDRCSQEGIQGGVCPLARDLATFEASGRTISPTPAR